MAAMRAPSHLSWRSRWLSTLATFVPLWALALLPEVSAAAKSAADYYVQSLPGAPEPLLRMYAGHIEIVPEHHGNTFFWLYKNRHIADRQRTVIWLNGGPGCSSMDGALMEAGPYRINPDGTLRLLDGSWDEFANVIFVDQPFGTGFSYIDTDSYVHEMDEMANYMVEFLTKFFEIFPEHAQDDLYIAGESYAGQWIPYVASAIVNHNAKSPRDAWNLSGLLIGNGWISGPDQYLATIPFAYEAGLLHRGSEVERVALEQQARCVKDLNADTNNRVDTGSCENIMQEILRMTVKDGKCTNMYDVRLTDVYPSCGMNWPPDLEYVTPYLRREDVKRALHINPDKKTGWVECNPQVSSAFTARHSKSSKLLLPALLEQMPIVLFSGDKDMICNHIGTENIINSLVWNGATGMEISPGMTAPKQDWTFEGEPAGQYQTARNLTYLRFYNSSHMVPFDVPRRSRDMLDRFMGVDIASIGGTPADSRIDGEKGAVVSVGGHPNSTVALEEESTKIQAAKWAAYRRSGEVALVFVIVLSLAFGYFVWRDRRRRQGYAGIMGSDPFDPRPSLGSGLGLNASRGSTKHRQTQRDVEAAREFDEAELDDLTAPNGEKGVSRDAEHFGLGDEDDENESNDGQGRMRNGHA